MPSQVSVRGQITIDRVAREKLDIRPGMVAYQQVVGDHLEVFFLPAPHRRSLFGAFHREGEQPKVVSAQDLEEAVMEAVAEKHAKIEVEDA